MVTTISARTVEFAVRCRSRGDLVNGRAQQCQFLLTIHATIFGYNTAAFLGVRIITLLQTSAAEYPGQQSPRPPADRMEARPRLESPPGPVPATAATASPVS